MFIIYKSITRALMSKFKKSQLAMVSVEFAAVIAAFITCMLFLMELCRFLYINAAINYTVLEQSRFASFAKGNFASDAFDYKTLFESSLRRNLPGWASLNFNDMNVAIDVQYCQNIRAVINKACVTQNQTNTYPIAVYNISYSYPFIFYLFTHLVNRLTLEVIYVQEYER